MTNAIADQHQIPMVIPFLGCLTGGALYDFFIYAGESPMNKPYLGLNRFLHPKKGVWSNTYNKALDSNV